MTAVSETTARIRDLNDAARKELAAGNIKFVNANFGSALFVTRGVEARGWDFVARALAAVRDFSDFTPENDPYGEHDFGAFNLDGVKPFWKIDCYDRVLEYASPDAVDAEKTRRILTVLLAEEY